MSRGMFHKQEAPYIRDEIDLFFLRASAIAAAPVAPSGFPVRLKTEYVLPESSTAASLTPKEALSILERLERCIREQCSSDSLDSYRSNLISLQPASHEHDKIGIDRRQGKRTARIRRTADLKRRLLSSNIPQ